MHVQDGSLRWNNFVETAKAFVAWLQKILTGHLLFNNLTARSLESSSVGSIETHLVILLHSKFGGQRLFHFIGFLIKSSLFETTLAAAVLMVIVDAL